MLLVDPCCCNCINHRRQLVFKNEVDYPILFVIKSVTTKKLLIHDTPVFCFLGKFAKERMDIPHWNVWLGLELSRTGTEIPRIWSWAGAYCYLIFAAKSCIEPSLTFHPSSNKPRMCARNSVRFSLTIGPLLDFLTAVTTSAINPLLSQ